MVKMTPTKKLSVKMPLKSSIKEEEEKKSGIAEINWG